MQADLDQERAGAGQIRSKTLNRETSQFSASLTRVSKSRIRALESYADFRDKNAIPTDCPFIHRARPKLAR
jgi:hypothetical protein